MEDDDFDILLDNYRHFKGDIDAFWDRGGFHPFLKSILKDLYRYIRLNKPYAYGCLEETVECMRLLVKGLPMFQGSQDLNEAICYDVTQRLMENGASQTRPFKEGVPRERQGNTINKEEGASSFFGPVLYPSSLNCPFCDNGMVPKQNVQVLLVLQDRIKPGLHIPLTCRNTGCNYVSCTRTYDSYYYKPEVNSTVLYRQLDRQRSILHPDQAYLDKREYIQVESRVFIHVDMVNRLSLDASEGISFTTQAKNYISNLSTKPLLVHLGGDPLRLLYNYLTKCNGKRLARDMQRAFFYQYLELLWLKEKYGEPMYENSYKAAISQTCQEIPIDEVEAEMTHLYPLRTFKQRFQGRFQTGAAANHLSSAINPRKMGFKLELDNALKILIDCYTDSRDVEGYHTCSLCQVYNAHTERLVTVYNIDGVALSRHCCSFGRSESSACTEFPEKYTDKTCRIHKPSTRICEVSRCG